MRRMVVLCAALLFGGLAAAQEAPLAPGDQESGPGSGRPRFRQVFLEYVGGEECVRVVPDPATLWISREPKRVLWLVTEPDETPYYWEIAWADGKAAGQEDFFAKGGEARTRAINCHQDQYRSVLPAGMTEDSYWPYAISVYACDERRQRGDLLCTKDPGIDWDP